jgi:hypothetical protein
MARAGWPLTVQPGDPRQPNAASHHNAGTGQAALSTGSGKREVICWGTIDVAFIRIWLRDPRPDDPDMI